MKNKENTKKKLLDAVGNIIRTEGFSGLGVNKVAKSAKVSKILIYRYFGNFSELLCAYILESDFWKNYLTNSTQEKDEELQLSVREEVSKILAEQSNTFYKHCEMEAMLVTEISRSNLMIKSLIRDENVPPASPSREVVSTLLLAGTDHMILAQENPDNPNQTHIFSLSREELMQSIGQIVDWSLD